MDDGRIMCWGSDGFGRTGSLYTGTTTIFGPYITQEAKGLPAPVKAIAEAEIHQCAVLTTGDVMCWGSNYYGQVGNDDNGQRFTATHVKNIGR